MNILYTNLKKLQYHDCWGQFINGDEKEQIDTSTTALLLLAFNMAGKENFTDDKIARIFKNYTTSEGCIDFTSGDTFDINRYSTEFGKSELTQGLLLSLYGNATD
jgi:UDP-N-acetyl-D-mannosaminuronic acid transferase (WecB/TagA/CpsF family)